MSASAVSKSVSRLNKLKAVYTKTLTCAELGPDADFFDVNAFHEILRGVLTCKVHDSSNGYRVNTQSPDILADIKVVESAVLLGLLGGGWVQKARENRGDWRPVKE